MKAFIETIARMTQDGEEVNGREFVMENDDAVATLNGLIEQARALVAKFPKKKAAKLGQIIEIRDGKKWYGRMVNYTTGPALAFCTFPDDGKPAKRSKAILAIMAARARGEIREGRDWLPAYLANLPRSMELEERIKRPLAPCGDAEPWEDYQKRRELDEAEIEVAKAELVKHKQKIFGKAHRSSPAGKEAANAGF